MFLLYLMLSSIFSLLAASCAFIITYSEYLKHFPDKRTPRKMALRTAFATFTFFMVLTALFVVAVIRLL